MNDDDYPKPKRGGSKKGRVFQKVHREPGDELRPHNFLLLDSEFAMLKRYGAGSGVRGLRQLLRVARSLEEARRR